MSAPTYASHRHLPPGIEAVCFVCGWQFKSMSAYLAHRFRDYLYVDPRGCAIHRTSAPKDIS